MNGGELFEQREDGNAVHYCGFEEKAFAFSYSQVAEFAVCMDDGAFVGSDSVGSLVESGTDVVDGGQAVFHVEGCGFEEDVGLGFL